MQKRLFAPLLLTGALLASLLAGCAGQSAVPDGPNSTVEVGEEQTQNEPNENTQEQSQGELPQLAAAQAWRTASDYSEVLTLLQTAEGQIAAGGDVSTNDTTQEESSDAVSPEAPMEDTESGSADYSGTNVQVEGIDEGDIVKTDGSYIYLLRGGELTILDAAGAETAIVGNLNLQLQNDNGYQNVIEMYYSDDTIAVLLDTYTYDEGKTDDGDYYYNSEQTCQVVLIDVADRTAPRETGRYWQEGWYTDSRLLDGKLYLISGQPVWNINADTPESYIPSYGVDGETMLLDAASIYLPAEPSSERYAIVSSYDLATENMVQKAFLGGCNTFYMTAGGLYLADSQYAQQGGEPYTRDQYTVVDYVEGNTTTILRLSPELELEATGAVDGGLLNQFALDEQDGTLRVVTTVSTSRYSVYTDEAYGFTNYVYDEDGGEQYNCLYVLDENLQPVGRLEHLAEDERVYAVRYQGDYAYVVTFYETDPLFVIDLSDPANPTVASELELPGFSNYLHVWQDGLLFGLGQNVDENGWTDGMKLSMYDISDPAAAQEITTLPLEATYSEALYNHKALLIAPERNLIGLPSDTGYLLFSYDAASGFTQTAEIAFDYSYGYNTRAVYIGDALYICSPDQVTVLNLNDASVLWEHVFAVG